MDRQDRLTGCLRRVMGPPPRDLTPTASLADDLGFESLDLVELVMEIEHEFKVEVTEEQGDGLRTWGDCIKLVNKLVEAKLIQAKEELHVIPGDERKQHANAAGAGF